MPQLDLDGANSKISADTIRGQSGTTVTVQSGHNLVGSGSGLTALPAANLTGTLPAISGASLTSLNASNIASGTVASARLPSLGKVVQVVNTQTGAVATGTTIVPFDDTIPQNSEGDEYLSVAITPTNASNILQFCVVLHAGHSTTNVGEVVALFQDSTAGALASTLSFINRSTDTQNLSLAYRMTAGTTSSTTFKIRAGGGGAGTTTLNGRGGTRAHGGVLTSSLTIWEISV